MPLVPDLAITVQPNAQTRLLDFSAEVSRDYREFMVGAFADTTRSRSKAIGQFLTPQPIFESMVKEAISALPRRAYPLIRIIDPFCGDGRLLVAFLNELKASNIEVGKVELFAWDIDQNILEIASESIAKASVETAFQISAQIELRDAFFCEDDLLGTFDVIVTNPPWSSTKSLKPRAFENERDYDRYQEVANSYCRLLVERYPEVRGGRSFGAGALNLSRFGIALSCRLLNPQGLCAIVMPSSFAADTSSAPLREIAFGNLYLRSLHYYPAEMKLFAGADQAAIYVVLAHGCAEAPGKVVSHAYGSFKSYETSADFWTFVANNGWAVPLGYSEEELALIKKLSKSPMLGSFKEIKLGREVDETRIAERLCEDSPYRFVKGFMITCYDLSDEEKWYYDPAKASVPPSADAEKVVWRDVSRVSQKKRVQATLLPPGHVAGNSLGVAICADRSLLRSFLGVLNSSVFEFVARSMLTTNHVSAGTLKRMPFPHLDSVLASRISVEVDAILTHPHDVATKQRIDELVSFAYGLTDEELLVAQNAVHAVNQLVLELQESK